MPETNITTGSEGPGQGGMEPGNDISRKELSVNNAGDALTNTAMMSNSDDNIDIDLEDNDFEDDEVMADDELEESDDDDVVDDDDTSLLPDGETGDDDDLSANDGDDDDAEEDKNI